MNGDLIYKKTTPSDHMAMEVEIKVNIELPEKKGNTPIFDYNKDDGWLQYQTNSNKIAKDIISLIDKRTTRRIEITTT